MKDFKATELNQFGGNEVDVFEFNNQMAVAASDPVNGPTLISIEQAVKFWGEDALLERIALDKALGNI